MALGTYQLFTKYLPNAEWVAFLWKIPGPRHLRSPGCYLRIWHTVETPGVRHKWVSALVLVFIQPTTLSSCPDRGGKGPI